MTKIQGAYNKYEYWLASIVSLSGRKKIFLGEMFSEAEEVYRARQESLERITILTEREIAEIKAAQGRTEEEIEEELSYCAQRGINLTVWREETYPLRLRDIYNPPYGLFTVGGFLFGRRNRSVLWAPEIVHIMENLRRNRLDRS